jgi:hypothetical protein
MVLNYRKRQYAARKYYNFVMQFVNGGGFGRKIWAILIGAQFG